MLEPDEAQKLVEQHGSIAAAARYLGVSSSTFGYWLDPDRYRQQKRKYRECAANRERERQQKREHYWANPERARQLDRARRAANPERRRQQKRERYAALSGPEYNLLLLKNRRHKALARQRKRNQRSKEV